MARVWVVEGPTSEWADGVGPLAVFVRKRDAEEYVRGEKAELTSQAYELLGLGEVAWPLFADHRQLRRAAARVRAGRGISWRTARETLGWPYTVADFEIYPADPGEVLDPADYEAWRRGELTLEEAVELANEERG